jgi:predicted RNase H-like nuclease (RuvC/YqgF family)
MARGILFRSLALIAMVFSVAAVRLAAQDEPSVAEAARRARQQKQEASKPAKVVTNDTLAPSPAAAPATPTTPSDSAAPPAATEPAAGTSVEAKKPAETAEEAEKKKQEIESLKKEIADKEDAVKTLRGAIVLDQNTYYSNPNYRRDTAGKAKIDDEKADLERMQTELDELKAKLADLGVVSEPKPPEPKPSITQNAPPS